MQWFGSDFHLHHKMLWKKYRSQFSSIQEMDEYIINTIKEKLKPGDIFYFLGDLCWTLQSGRDFFNVFPRNVHFHFIEGNHDHKFIKKFKKEFPRIHIWTIKNIKVENQAITCCHYPMLSWNKSHYGAWQIFGHHHSDGVNFYLRGKQMNVCLDVIGFDKVIISFDEVQKYMETRPDNWDLIKE
jgi:calcineurin-like phosphoesterase family protein